MLLLWTTNQQTAIFLSCYLIGCSQRQHSFRGIFCGLCWLQYCNSTGWQFWMVTTYFWLGFEMLCHPAWAVGSYSRVPPSARSARAKSTRGFDGPLLWPFQYSSYSYHPHCRNMERWEDTPLYRYHNFRVMEGANSNPHYNHQCEWPKSVVIL